uniref:ZP domain-containing protein n=1 Tax=Strongyloides papillosus TaxID=174720 RepID=A0A0N5BF01_STREA
MKFFLLLVLFIIISLSNVYTQKNNLGTGEKKIDINVDVTCPSKESIVNVNMKNSKDSKSNISRKGRCDGKYDFTSKLTKEQSIKDITFDVFYENDKNKILVVQLNDTNCDDGINGKEFSDDKNKDRFILFCNATLH